MGSNRSFGIIFLLVFCSIGLWPLLSDGEVRLWALLLAPVFGLLAAYRPHYLEPLNKLWFQFGVLLNAIVSPVVISLMFYLIVTPTAVMLRAFGKDPLGRRFNKTTDSYWIKRETPLGTLKNQY